jgi:hypothetical protein
MENRWQKRLAARLGGACVPARLLVGQGHAGKMASELGIAVRAGAILA